MSTTPRLCPGSYRTGIRRNPVTGSAECPDCSMRIDRRDLLGDTRIPAHDPKRYPTDDYTRNGRGQS